MKSFFRNSLLLSTLFCSFENLAKAEGGSGRTNHRFGLYAGVLSDPFPGLVTYGVKINITNFLQLFGGYTSLSGSSIDPATLAVSTLSVTTYGGGAKLLMPKWRFSPYAGFGYSNTPEGSVTLLGTSLSAGIDGTAVTYGTFGLDYQGLSGFNFGFGFHYVISPALISDVLKTVPNIYIGWFF